jgi:hypothetical protein
LHDKKKAGKLISDYEKNKNIAQNPIVCEDNSTCDPLSICCKMADGDYGCCPYIDGICCTQLSYCCPGNSFCGKIIGLFFINKLLIFLSF